MRTLEFTRDEFAADRRGVLTRGDDRLRPVVLDALSHWGQGSWWKSITTAVLDLAADVAMDEGADDRALALQLATDSLKDTLDAALRKTHAPANPPSDVQVEQITRWLSTAATNVGTFVATTLDPQDLDLEWVTMHDTKVRASHREADGQTVPAGSTFDVGGYHLHHPGEPVGPPEVWINCRCVVRPTLGDAMGAKTTTEDFAGNPLDGLPPLDDPTADPTVEPDDEVDPEAPIPTDEELDLDVPLYGVLAPEGVPTGDKRGFDPGSLRYRDLPLPLRWQKVDEPGHDGSVVFARIDNIWREDGLHKFEGMAARTPEAEEVLGLIAEGMLRGVSVDLDDVTQVEMRNADGTPWEAEVDGDFNPEEPTSWVTDGRIASACVVSIPAFQEAFVAIGTWADANVEPHEPPAIGSEPDDDEPEQGEPEPEAHTSSPLPPFAISEAPWDGNASRFNDAQWKASCILDRGESFPTAKTRYALPIKEPSGDLSRAGVHAAAGRLDQVKASDAAKAAAKSALRSAYGQLDEEPPEAIAASAFAPGTHDGPGWITHPRATARIRRYWVHGKGAAKIKWGLPHDFYRCRTQLRKYVQNPAWLDGLCANMHKEALGVWPGGEDLHRGQKHALEGEAAPAFTLVECTDCLGSLVASGASLPPADWFVDPELDGPTGIVVEDDGRIYGHIATWGTCHIGIPGQCVTPPQSHSNYAYFRTGVVRTDDGDIPVGHITLDTGHADLSLSATSTLAHYDQTGMVAADVVAGEDEYGIWIAGAARPNLDEGDLAVLRSAPLSGDWRTIGGHLEMVAALGVNVPGFPIPRVALAASGGEQRTLVAAGFVPREKAKPEVGTVVVRVVPEVDTEEFAKAVDAALDKLGVKSQRSTKLSAARARMNAERLAQARQRLED